MDKIVLDTSVIVKWFSLEEGRKQALKIRDGVVAGKIKPVVPELVFYELINACWFGKRLTNRRIARILDEFRNLEPEIATPDKKLTSLILKLIDKFPITAYDAAFIALAEKESIPLVTADTKHHKKIYSQRIAPLEEF